MSVNYQTHTLSNGLKIVTINFPQFHTITNFLVIRSGSRYETLENNGIAHFLEHMVFKGTKSFGSPKIVAETIEGVGGYFNAWTSNDHTAYWNVVPAAEWQRGLQVASELAFYPNLPKDDLERERGVIIEEIRRMNDNPAGLVHDLVGGLIFPNNPLGYSVIGSEEIIKKVTIEDFKSYHQAHYLASQATFVCAGNLDGKDIVGEIEKLLGQVKSGEVTKPNRVTAISQAALKLQKKATDQTHFVLAISDPSLNVTSDERFVVSVLDGVLGNGMSSRLFMNIREKKGLAYSIHSDYEIFEDTGDFEISGGVNTGKIHQTLEALDEELERLQNELVGEQELNKAIAKVVGHYDLSADRPVDLATWYGTNWLLGEKLTYEQMQERVRAVTAAQVQQLAQKLFKKDQQTLAVIGPYDNDEQFRQFLKIG